MRIRDIAVTDIPPVKVFNVENLSDLVVIAGPNGVGKTRLVSSLLAYFRKLSGDNPRFAMEATDDSEREAWGKPTLDTSQADDAVRLRALLQQNRRRRNFMSSIVYYESTRAIQQIKPLTFQFEYPDPWEESVPWDLSLRGLSNRWQDTQHAIFKKIQSQKMSIANRAIQLRNEGRQTMNLEFNDPLEPFRDAFGKLLGPKTLHSADVQNQRLIYEEEGEERDIASLSSGEREVLTITFDFILRKPSHSIVFLDEPELHLHPELLARLISTLRTVGDSNQFFLVSHSPEVIASSLDDSVIFLTPPAGDSKNQAVVLNAQSDTAEALHRLGQSVGVVSLGKKIVLIEGTDSSLDKQTYSHLLKNRFPELVLLPSGGKGNLSSFEKVVTEVLDKSLWGIRFYMLADRDASPQNALSKASENFRTLKRYHLENYFLDAVVLSQCFEEMESTDSWLRSPTKIDEQLRDVAKQQLEYATALLVSKRVRDGVGNVDVMVKGAHSMSRAELIAAIRERSTTERERTGVALEPEKIVSLTLETHDHLAQLVEGGDGWKVEFPGKQVFSRFCNIAKIPEGRLKTLYLAKAESTPVDPFAEIIEIFRHFAEQ